MNKMLNGVVRRVVSDKFLRNVGTLAGGAVAGRIITFAFLPFITRLYSPEDFSALAFYIGLLTMMSAVANLRFDVAIPVPADDKTALDLFVLSISCGLVFSLLLSALLIFPGDDFLSQFSPPMFQGYWFMLPLGVFFFSLYTSFQYWAARKKRFASIALTRVSQSISGGVTSLVAGIFGLAPVGLLLGNMLNTSAGALRMVREFFMHDLRHLTRPTSRDIIGTFQVFRRYPKFAAPEAFANAAGTQLPIVLLATVVVGDDAGQLLLAMQVMLAPMALVGVAIGKVYLANGGEAYRSGSLKQLTLDVQSKLIKLGLGPIVLVGVLSPFMFPLIFGEKWEKAGLFVMWMTPWIALQFLSSPISACFHITNNQKTGLLLQLAGFAIRIGSIGVAALLVKHSQALWFIVSSAIFYLIFLWVEFRILKIGLVDVLVMVRNSAFVLVLVALIATAGIFII